MATVNPDLRPELHDRFDRVAHQLCNALILARAALALVERIEEQVPDQYRLPDSFNLAVDVGRLAVAAVDRSGDVFEDLQREMLDRFAPFDGEKRPRPAPLAVV